MADNYIPQPRGLFQDKQAFYNPGAVHRSVSTLTFTRPNDTTPYTAGDAVGTLNSTILNFPVSRFANEGDSGYIFGVRAIKSVGTSATLKFYFFGEPISDTADNTPFSLTFLDARSYIGDITPAAMGGLTGSSVTREVTTKLPYVISGQYIYVVPTISGSYTPSANEVFQVTICLEQTASA